MSAAEIRNQFNLLELERLEAESVGLLDNERYRWALDQEMARCRAAYLAPPSPRSRPSERSDPAVRSDDKRS